MYFGAKVVIHFRAGIYSLPSTGTAATDAALQQRSVRVWGRSTASPVGIINPLTDHYASAWALPGPIVELCIRVVALAVVPQSGWYQPFIVFLGTVIGVIWQPDTQEAASLVVVGMSDAGVNLPVHVHPLPGAGPYEHYCYRGLAYMAVPNLSPYRLGS